MTVKFDAYWVDDTAVPRIKRLIESARRQNDVNATVEVEPECEHSWRFVEEKERGRSHDE